MDIWYEEIETHIDVLELLCLGVHPEVWALENPDEGYGPIYTGVLGIPEIKSCIWIYAFVNMMLWKKRFLLCLYELIECSYYDTSL